MHVARRRWGSEAPRARRGRAAAWWGGSWARAGAGASLASSFVVWSASPLLAFSPHREPVGVVEPEAGQRHPPTGPRAGAPSRRAPATTGSTAAGPQFGRAAMARGGAWTDADVGAEVVASGEGNVTSPLIRPTPGTGTLHCGVRRYLRRGAQLLAEPIQLWCGCLTDQLRRAERPTHAASGGLRRLSMRLNLLLHPVFFFPRSSALGVMRLLA